MTKLIMWKESIKNRISNFNKNQKGLETLQVVLIIAVAAIITTIVPLVIFVVFQRFFTAGAQTRTGSKE